MKYLFVLISFFYVSSNYASISLQKALEDGLVGVQILANDKSTHYNRPFKLQVVNNSKQKLDLVLENGSVFVAEDNSEQDFIITKEVLLALQEKEVKDNEIHAKCLEQSKSAPSSSSTYKLGGLANKNLRSLSAFIEANENYEPDAQFLIWDIADGYYLEDEIDDFMIDDNGQVWVVDLVEGERNVLSRLPEEEVLSEAKLIVSGEFSMNFSKTQNVHIAMFNDQNVIVKELYKNPNCPAGLSELKYEFDSYQYPEEVYFVKLVVDGEIRLTRKIEMKF